ncbi:MAG TPA: hydrogenase expression/formation protein HupK, partial [Tabrizicola sp.]|nr:hydrogenase expression/formation protein HupK [Tabrizicola sp.]
THLPLEALVLGKTVAEAAELLPRLFNLCRMAQGLAANLSLGRPATEDATAEILRDHVLKLCVTLPKAFNLPPTPIPLSRGAEMALAGAADLLGPNGLANDPAEMSGPLAPLFRHIAATFPPGIAACPALPVPRDPLAEGPFENSAAGRQSHHPLLRRIEETHGRGPLWRLAGLMADLEAALQNRLPKPTVINGTATVPAARGTYALRITHRNGIVTGLTRRTPTDHMLAPDGALLKSLATLPEPLHHLAPQVIALHDPCVPVTVREAQHA